MPSSAEGGEEEAVAEGRSHLEQLLSAKGSVAPFTAGGPQERDNEEGDDDDDEDAYWAPLGGSGGCAKAAARGHGGQGGGGKALQKGGGRAEAEADADADAALMAHVKGSSTGSAGADPTLFLGGAVLALIMSLFFYLILK